MPKKWKNLAPTPPMGWNSWNTFQTNITEDLIKHTADVMVESGVKNAGYIYVVLDDGWMKKATGTTAKPFTTTVPAHDVVMLRLSK